MQKSEEQNEILKNQIVSLIESKKLAENKNYDLECVLNESQLVETESKEKQFAEICAQKKTI